jgi:hypothetical protein
MKSKHRILPTLLFFICCMGLSQNPDQQQMIDKALKMRDSIMECMNLEQMLQQANAQEKRIEQKKNSKINTHPIKNTSKKEDNYWKNTLASENNVLKNWHNGEADLVYNYGYDSQKDAVKYVNVGVITSDGSILLNPTIIVPDLQPLNNFKNSNNFFDVHDSDVYQYNNGDSGFKLNSYILVYKNEKKIGVLTLGNSVKVTRNLLTQGDLYFGDEGYLISWVYVDEACSIKANENWKGDLSNTGTPLLVETEVTYNLSFKRGWNLVKTEIIGKYEFPNMPEEDQSRYKKHKHTIVATIPEEATYFYRSTL